MSLSLYSIDQQQLEIWLSIFFFSRKNNVASLQTLWRKKGKSTPSWNRMEWLNLNVRKTGEQKQNAITLCSTDSLWVIGRWKLGEYRSNVWPTLFSETHSTSTELPCCNFLLFICMTWCLFLVCLFSLQCQSCYLPLLTTCSFALLFLPASALWAFSMLFQQYPPKCDAQWCWAVSWRSGREPGSPWVTCCEGYSKLRMWPKFRKAFFKNRENRWMIFLENWKQ